MIDLKTLVKLDPKRAIKNLIEMSSKGITINEIAKKLDFSAQTITKYIKCLKVNFIKKGNTKVYYARRFKDIYGTGKR